MKVYIVGDDGPEHNLIRSIHRTYEGALNAWNELRISMLAIAKSRLKEDRFDPKMWGEIVRNLSCKDPKKMENYPQDTPYLKEYDVDE